MIAEKTHNRIRLIGGGPLGDVVCRERGGVMVESGYAAFGIRLVSAIRRVLTVPYGQRFCRLTGDIANDFGHVARVQVLTALNGE
jgi:hypothetical protein